MPTQQELNISSGSLSLIKQRDSGSGVIFVNPADSTVDIKIENYGFEIDNKSVNEHIDTAFSYYKFPARVIIEDINDVDLTSQLEAVTTDTALFYRYQASQMVLPNLDVPTIGRMLEIINEPQKSVLFMSDFSRFPAESKTASTIELKPRTYFQGYNDRTEISNYNNIFFDRVRNEGYQANKVNNQDVINYNYHYGVRYYLRKDAEYRDSRITDADLELVKTNPHTPGELGFLMLGWSDNISSGKLIDQWVIYEPYLKNSVEFSESIFFKIYNSLRYTPAGRRIVELDRIAKKQIRDGTSKGRYEPSSATSNEFNGVQYNEYAWNWYYVPNGRVSVVYMYGKNGEQSIYSHVDATGNRVIPQQTFQLDHTFDSILDENFQEIPFNQLVDGAQQLANRFTVTKDVLGYDADIAFNINIGLSHINSKNTFIIRLIRYDGASSNKYTVIKQLDHGDVKDTKLLITTTAATDYKALLNRKRQLETHLADNQKKLSMEQSKIELYKAEKTQLEKDYEAALLKLAEIQGEIAINEANIRNLQTQINTWKNSYAQKWLGVHTKEIAAAESTLTKLIANRSTLSTNLRAAKDNFEIIDERLSYIPRDIADWTNRANQTLTYINQDIKVKLADVNATIKALPSLGENADIILGEASYLLPGKSFFQFTHTILKSDLKPYDSYAVEILTNSPVTEDNGSIIFDWKSGKPMELITDNTSWEIMPVTEYTKQYIQRYKDEQATRYIKADSNLQGVGGNVGTTNTGSAGTTLDIGSKQG